ncbi:MAG: AAA family ATPase [Proteobacteria bacterium]|nr:AAA family ATPase [Pseudomonadota bacterium]
MMWTLRRILILIVLISSLAVVGTLVWVTATYQRFAIDTQNDSTATMVAYQVNQRIEKQYRQKVTPFINEWSRLSTLINGVRENAPWKTGIAADRMMQTIEVTEGRVRLLNVVVYTKEMKVLAMAEKGSEENLATHPQILKRLKQRDLNQQRHLEAFLWRTSEGRPVHSIIAPVGGFQVFGFIEFVTDPTPELAGMGDAFGGTFKLFDHKGTLLFESFETPGGETEPNRPQPGLGGEAGAVRLETLRVEIADSIGAPWAVATITRDMSGFKGAIATLRDQAIGIVAGVVLGSILLGWLLLRLAVFSRLRKFASVMETLAQGDTETEIPATGPDEFRTMSTALEDLRREVGNAFSGDEFETQRKAIAEENQAGQRALFQRLEQEARAQGFTVQFSPDGVGLLPLKDGRPLSPEDFLQLPETERREFESRREGLMRRVESTMDEVRALEHETSQRLADLRTARNDPGVARALEELDRSCTGGANVVPAILECARSGCTLYEIRHAMERTFGSYEEPVFF